jgi:hypothetical protein
MCMRESLSSAFIFKPTRNEQMTIFRDLVDDLDLEEFI